MCNIINNNKFFNLELGLPKNEQIWFQQPASPVMEGIIDLQLVKKLSSAIYKKRWNFKSNYSTIKFNLATLLLICTDDNNNNTEIFGFKKGFILYFFLVSKL